MKKTSILFTQSGFNTFKKEYDDLLNKRPEFVKQLTIARDMGDRSENAAYKSARRTLSSTDSRLRFLKRIVDNAKVVKPLQTDSVEIGSIVTVDNGRQQIIFTIVGEHEADPMNRKLSYRSPVGQALLRRKKDDSVNILIPSGTIEYRILDIQIG